MNDLPITAPAPIGGVVHDADPVPAPLFERTVGDLRQRGAVILQQEIYVPLARLDEAMAALAATGTVDWPVSWLPAENAELPTATRIRHRGTGAVERIRLDGRTVGSRWEDADGSWCLLGGLTAADAAADPPGQTAQVFDRLVRALDAAELSFADVARTWFANAAILDWYDDFNRVRTACFEEHRVFEGLLPASTGVGGSPGPAGEALVVGALAVRPDPDSQLSLRTVGSPLQCEATTYRSSFSRAVVLETAVWRHLLVSGTASIAPDGKTAHRDDPVAQTVLTLDVVEALLGTVDLGWADVDTGVAYIKPGVDPDDCLGTMADRGLADLPLVVTVRDICRDDLLFELEVEASGDRGNGRNSRMPIDGAMSRVSRT